MVNTSGFSIIGTNIKGSSPEGGSPAALLSLSIHLTAEELNAKAAPLLSVKTTGTAAAPFSSSRLLLEGL